MGQQNILVLLGNVPSAFRIRFKVGGLAKLKWMVLKWTAIKVNGLTKVDGINDQKPKSKLYDMTIYFGSF